jgi:hypothetical protein
MLAPNDNSNLIYFYGNLIIDELTFQVTFESKGPFNSTAKFHFLTFVQLQLRVSFNSKCFNDSYYVRTLTPWQ